MPDKIVKSSIILSLFTKLSRLLGLLRDNLCGRYFGTSAEFGIFTLAFRLPDLWRRLSEERVFSSILLPKIQAEDQANTTKEYSSYLASLFFMVTITLVGFSTIILLGLHFLQLSQSPLIRYSLILLPYLSLVMLMAIFSSILFVLNKFLIPAISPALFNMIWIIGILFAVHFFTQPRHQIETMVFAILLAGVIQCLLLYVAVLKNKWVLFWNIKKTTSSLLRFMKEYIPILISLSVYQILLLLSGIFLILAHRTENDLAAIYFSDRVQQLPFGIFAIAITTATFPSLSAAFLQNNKSDFSFYLSRSFRLIWFLILPSMIGVFFLHEEIVQVLFAFKENHSITQTSQTLLSFNIGLLFTCTVPLLNRAVYACGYHKALLQQAFFLIGITSVLLLFLLLQQQLTSITAAYTLSFVSLLQFCILFFYLIKKELMSFTALLRKGIAFFIPSLALVIWLFFCRSIQQGDIFFIKHSAEVARFSNASYVSIVVLSSVFLYFVMAIFCQTDEWKLLKAHFTKNKIS